MNKKKSFYLLVIILSLFLKNNIYTKKITDKENQIKNVSNIKEKRCALLLFGISYCSEYKHPYFNKKLKIEYNKSYHNYKKHIYKYFEDKGYVIDVYFSTNISNQQEHKKIIEIYKPISYSFLKDNKNKLLSRNEKLLDVTKLCLNSNIKYDTVLITRFDLKFKKNFDKSNIKLDKFNLVSVLEKKKYICDNFYLFPFSKLKAFNYIVKKNFKESFHNIRKELENIENKKFVNYILNENNFVSKLSFYKIYRNQIK